MKTLTFCSYNRNYGCRIKEYSINNLRVVSIENSLIRVGILLDKGTDIYEFIYKPKDIDFMWRSYQPIRNNEYHSAVSLKNGNFFDYYEGGWQELFPNIGKACHVGGAEYGMHGEVDLMPWDMKILCDEKDKVSIELRVRTARTPYYLIKTITLYENELVVHFDETVINEGLEEMQFAWGQHPALGGNFLDEDCEIIVDGHPLVKSLDVELGVASPIALNLEAKWPIVTTRVGDTIDLSKVLSPESKTYMEFGLCDIEKPYYEVKNKRLNVGFGMSWDKSIYPNIWVWQLFGGGIGFPFYGRGYTLALEPWSSMPACLTDAIENGSAIKIGAGESIIHSFEAFVKLY